MQEASCEDCHTHSRCVVLGEGKLMLGRDLQLMVGRKRCRIGELPHLLMSNGKVKVVQSFSVTGQTLVGSSFEVLAVVITPRETGNGPVHLVVTPDALRGISCATR